MLACTVLSTGSPVAAQEDRLGPSSVFELEYADDPRISPDGRTLAYVRHTADRETDRAVSNIHIVDLELGADRPMTQGREIKLLPRFSPDGTRVAWIGSSEGLWRIRIQSLGTHQPRTLVTTTLRPQALAWSPRGDELAYMLVVEHPESRMAALPERPPGEVWAEPARVIGRVVSQVDGVEFAPDGNTQLFVVPTTSGAPRRVTRSGFEVGAWAPGSSFNYSPDGASVIFSANVNEEPWRDPLDTEVVQVVLATGAVQTLTNRDGPDDEPVVSPDGQWIAYTGFDDQRQWYQPRRLYLASTSGVGERRVLSTLFDGDVSGPAWSADGTGVFALIEESGLTRLARFDLLGGFSVVADSLGTGGRASGGTAQVTVSNMPEYERFAVTVTHPDLAGEIGVGGGLGPTRLVTTDRSARPIPLGRVESIRYSSSHDGLDIQGWVVLPPDFEPTRRYPLIVEVHGGRGSHYGPRFDLEKQVFAAAGYIVLYPNYRGSSSYGAEFGNLVHRSHSEVEHLDLLSGADALIERGWVDPDRLYVVGGSMGGHLAGWAISNTDRFRAAAVWYPVVNWATYWMTAGYSPEMLRYHHEAYPWEAPEEYESKSLLSVVDRVDTPTLIVVGDEDYITPVQEAIAYFRALRIVGVESLLVRVPGEPHGIRSRPSHQAAKLQATLEWIGFYDRQITTEREGRR
ncbi:MAG: S9 family peptidase [Gemmatimonadota bacterium]|nr:S9 family peptidase [Gemmatimonadota bacterium]